MNLKRVQELLVIDGDFNYHKESGRMEFLWLEKHDGGYNEPCGEPVEKEEAVRILNEYREGLKMLQEQNKELLADAKRLFVLVEDYEKHTHVIGTGDVKEQHNALSGKVESVEQEEIPF